MDTRVFSPAALCDVLNQPGRYGKTSAKVLETCSLVAAADAAWDPEVIRDFQDTEDVHEKVWAKLVSIAKDERLKQVDPSILPKSYTALYALVVMTQPEWDAALEQNVIHAGASSRSILDWTRKFRLGTPPDHQEVSLTLLLERGLDPTQIGDLLQELNVVSRKYGGTVFQGKLGSRVKAALDKRELAQRCFDRLKILLRDPVRQSSEDLRESFGIFTGGELARTSKKVFTAFMVRHCAEKGLSLLPDDEESIIANYPEHYLVYCAYAMHQANSTLGRMRTERHLRNLCKRQSVYGTPEMKEVIQVYAPDLV
jgi:hypothetical protein